MGSTEIAKVRFCGGSISETLNSNDMPTFKEVQTADLKVLEELLGREKARWVKEVANGVCHEEVSPKGHPNAASGIKTFKKVQTFEELEKFIVLCVIDVNQKVADYLEDFQIFPTSLGLNWRTGKTAKSRRFEMLPMDEYLKRPRSLCDKVIPLFREMQDRLLPAFTIGVSVTNFKNVSDIKKEQSQQIKSFFTVQSKTPSPK